MTFRIPRVLQKSYYFTCVAVGLFMLFGAGKVVFSASYENIPLPVAVFLGIFLAIWFGGVCFLVLYYGITALETIELDRDEIRVCIGRFVLRRIPVGSIKTVGLSVLYGKGDHVLEVLLVLSPKTPEELSIKGRRRLEKAHVRRRMLREGIDPEGDHAAAKAYLFGHFMRAALWIQNSEQAQAALRTYLPNAVFICK